MEYRAGYIFISSTHTPCSIYWRGTIDRWAEIWLHWVLASEGAVGQLQFFFQDGFFLHHAAIPLQAVRRPTLHVQHRSALNRAAAKKLKPEQGIGNPVISHVSKFSLVA